MIFVICPTFLNVLIVESKNRRWKFVIIVDWGAVVRDAVLHRLRSELQTKTKVTGFGVHIHSNRRLCLATAIDPEVVRKPVLAHSWVTGSFTATTGRTLPATSPLILWTCGGLACPVFKGGFKRLDRLVESQCSTMRSTDWTLNQLRQREI